MPQSIDTWGGVTDPSEYIPWRFRYLVHGFLTTSFEEELSGRDRVTHLRQRLIKLDEKYAQNPKYGPNDPSLGDQSIDLQDEPERVAERVVLRTSLIDQVHLTTWGDAGLIVEIPKKNILLTHNNDASTSSNVAKLRELSRADPPMTPEDLLSSTSRTLYSEVVALAGGTSLVGFFCQGDADPRRMSDFPSDAEMLAGSMQSHATRLNLPFVILPKFPMGGMAE